MTAHRGAAGRSAGCLKSRLEATRHEDMPAPSVRPRHSTTEEARIKCSIRDVAAAKVLITRRCRLGGVGVKMIEALTAKEQLEHTALNSTALRPQQQHSFAAAATAQLCGRSNSMSFPGASRRS
eukprot:365925-Chlamydomonas_euryale.AAC.11